MKNLKSILAKTCIVLFVGSAILMGCKKNDLTVSQEKPQKTNQKTKESNKVSSLEEDPEITTLKTYMAGLTNIDINEITYDSETEQFIAFGVNQISKTDLASSYQDNGMY